MTRLFTFTYLVLIPFLAQAQSADSSTVDHAKEQLLFLEDLINHNKPDKTKLIFYTDKGFSVDTHTVKKVVYTPGKSSLQITYTDRTYIQVSAANCWGFVNDFQQCQRFYNGKRYVVWHTTPPYIYRKYGADGNKIKYFYSETLTSEVIPLTKENVYAMTDSNTIKQLHAYLKENNIKKSKDASYWMPTFDVFSGDFQLSPLQEELLYIHLWLFITILEEIDW